VQPMVPRPHVDLAAGPDEDEPHSKSILRGIR
jgi:hypothetical protein